MRNFRIIKKKDLKHVLELIKQQWGCEFPFDAIFLINKKDNIYIVNKDLARIDFKNLNISTIGLYFGELKHNMLRLSVDGSQIIGPLATKNILKVDDKEALDWLRGLDLDKQTDLKNFVIIKNKNDFLGSGKVQETKILNFVPKNRRIPLS